MVGEKETALRWIDENSSRIIEVSDEIWEYAELGLLEFKSSKLLMKEFEKHSFKIEENVGGMPTAFVAMWGKGKPEWGILHFGLWVSLQLS